MTQQEFIQRTGVEVSNDEFWAINEVYNCSDIDKDEFCKLWCKMNPVRVKNAKVERMNQKKEAAYKDALYNWFKKWDKTQKFYDNYYTSIAYIKMSTFEIQALSYAGILFHENISLSDIHFKVGQYLGIYRSL